MVTLIQLSFQLGSSSLFCISESISTSIVAHPKLPSCRLELCTTALCCTDKASTLWGAPTPGKSKYLCSSPSSMTDCLTNRSPWARFNWYRCSISFAILALLFLSASPAPSSFSAVSGAGIAMMAHPIPFLQPASFQLRPLPDFNCHHSTSHTLPFEWCPFGGRSLDDPPSWSDTTDGRSPFGGWSLGDRLVPGSISQRFLKMWVGAAASAPFRVLDCGAR